ncbi:polysaccharide pyruvyl transferase family protein [Alkalibacillus salilacus]|uniref:Polysaccharide pyruvyl transferase domain-containing protein n=1 Tax=Alkalibacillus salilacus TaxID=284582 RepID=A0ABT9VHW8_9BACI|nr:polysaccharide pyruvyl transferase family protein [Alkalibacillus salilacus]MDQ0160551.1 hypothetical protein [Alkalibacillus salilacus]
MEKKRVAMTGPFADVNFGDYAMLVNNLFDLYVEDVLLFTYDDKFLNKIKEDYLMDFNLEIRSVLLAEEFKNYTNTNYAFTPIEIISMINNYDELLNEMRNVDVLIVNGGGYFNSLWSKPHRLERLVKIIAPILIANQLGKEIAFTGNSYGPFEDDVNFFSSILGSLNNVTFGCRDDLYSPIWARQAGIVDKNIKKIPDDLLFINNNLKKWPKNYNIECDNYIVMETYLPLDYLEENIEKFRTFTTLMYNKYGVKTVFLPLHLGNGGLEQAEFLSKHLDYFEYVDISEKGYLPIQDSIEIIQNATFLVCSRYHSFVLALENETPTMSVLKEVMGDKRYYYNKNAGVLNLVLNNTGFDERYYLGTDFIRTLKYIEKDFIQIVNEQKSKYNLQYLNNKKNLYSIRENYLSQIVN